MQKNTRLSQEQQRLVENNLSIVHWVIRKSIHVNETICGFEYDDLYQEGCIWLCKAAATYNAAKAGFPTYAKKVVRNGLFSYCRRTCSRQKHFTRLAVNEQGEFIRDDPAPKQPDSFALLAGTMETLELLASAKEEYGGVTKLGIEALELKVKGMGISEIASLYNVPASHVGAWISRASRKLRGNPAFLSGLM